MSPSGPAPRCLAHRRHLASCTTCVRHLLAKQRGTGTTSLRDAA